MRLLRPLSCVTFLLVLSAASGALSEDDHRRILEQLRDTFRGFRLFNQYAVLYIPQPNNPGGQVAFCPTPPNYEGQRDVLYHRCYANDYRYAYNYAVAIPDFRAAVYGTAMNRRRTIHTEDLLMNYVWPRMLTWYRAQYGEPSAIYIFTHFLPCRNCFPIIQMHHYLLPNVSIYVGFSDLFGGERERGDPARQGVTRERFREISNFLANGRGGLFQLGDCPERGWSARSKRSVTDSCPASTQGREFVIGMDFSSGKAVVYFSGLNGDYWGWFGLYNRKSERQTWEWSNSATAGKKVFSKGFLSEGYEVRYFAGYHETDLSLTSYKWDRCGFNRNKLNNLPSSYGASYISLEIKDGSPVIVIDISNFGATSSYDWVGVQAIDQIKSESYWSYQWVAYLTKRSYNERAYKFYYRLDSSLSKGFRLKYVYYASGYQWKEMYDNASPFWTPDGCRGGG